MKDTLTYLLMQLVEFPDAIEVSEKTEGERTLLTISADPRDMGKIIGKQGRIIRAMRDMIKLIATKHKSYVDVILTE